MGAMVVSCGLLTSTPVGAFPQFTPEGSFKMHCLTVSCKSSCGKLEPELEPENTGFGPVTTIARAPRATAAATAAATAPRASRRRHRRRRHSALPIVVAVVENNAPPAPRCRSIDRSRVPIRSVVASRRAKRGTHTATDAGATTRVAHSRRRRVAHSRRRRTESSIGFGSNRNRIGQRSTECVM
jgi:hypothetical protein